MKRRKLAAGLCIAGVAVVGLIVADRMLQKPPPTRESILAQIPPDIRNPASGAVELTGRELVAFQKRTPLRVGRSGPRLQTKDYRGEMSIRIPADSGLPTACVVSCGCLECGGVLTRLANLRKEQGERFQVVGLIATRSSYSWGHYASGFQFQPVKLFQDPTGEFRRLMRPPGNEPTRLPLIWVADGKGVVRYVAQPHRDSRWEGEVRQALGLPARG